MKTGNRSFNIDEQSVSGFFKTTGTDDNSVTNDLLLAMQALQRTLKLTGDTLNLNSTTVLFTRGLTSSSSIVNKGQLTFTRDLVSGGLTEQVASGIWCKAKATNDATMMMAMDYLKYEKQGALMPKSLSVSSGFFTVPATSLPPNLPNMTTLFGNMDTCTCEQCLSVYSASAYLTDLLNWLRKDVIFPTTPFKPGLDALEKSGAAYRRSDIRHLKLSCINTNVVIPYIDIVNEILSVDLLQDTAAYAAMAVPARVSFLTNTYKTLQTTKTAEEVLVQPEYRFPTSEALLKGKTFPWKLPYDVEFDETLTYTNANGIPYHELITNFSPATVKRADQRWAYALLNINAQEGTLFTTNLTGSTFWQNYYGLTGVSGSPSVGKILSTTGLTIAELEEIFTALYVNEAGSRITIVPSTDLCNLDTYTFSPAFSTDAGQRLMKFLRLKRKTGLSTWELDIAIKNIGTGIDSNFLQKLAACLDFSKQHNISFSDLMVWYGNNAYHDVYTLAQFSTYYKNKFLNPLLPDFARTFFTASPYASNVMALTNEQKQALSITMDVELAVVDKIIIYLNPGAVSFTSAILSNIHRHASLIKLFGLSASQTGDIALFVAKLGNVFSSSNIISAAWSFSQAQSEFKKLGVSLSDFTALMEGAGAYSTAALDAGAQKVWEGVEKAFQEAHLANPDKLFPGPTYLPVAGNIPTFTNVVSTHLSLAYNLKKVDVEAIVNKHLATWFNTFITDPDGLGGAANLRTWANKSALFVPVHRLLLRIQLLSTIFALEPEAIASGIEVAVKTTPTLSAPGTPFYWLTNSYAALTPTSLTSLIWLKNASQQAGRLNLSQPAFFVLVSDYVTTYSTTYTVAVPAKIISLYNSLGASSIYKQLSVYEFVEIFVRARSIAVIAGDLVALLTAFDTIYKSAQLFNIKAADAWAWVWQTGWASLTFTAVTPTYAMAKDIRRALNSKFPEFTAWSDVIVPYQNDLRQRMRDALVAYFIGYRGFADDNKLYAYYLLDTQMAPCMQISRIVAAISSVQLLVHRALLGLEPEVYMSAANIKEWEWRKNYRVWEANRKVFLYPENWIDPSLRKNKTELFKEAEDLLQQDEINDRNSELAYAGYLTGLNEVAHLDMRAMYVEDPKADLAAGDGMLYKNNPDEILHVFGRTWNPPYVHYYRKLDHGVWSGWEKMDLEIDSDHLIPVMYNRKLYLFYPMFVEKIWKGNDKARYWEIQLCYTKLDFGKWAQKKVLPAKLLSGPTANAAQNPYEIGSEDDMWLKFADPQYRHPQNVKYANSNLYGPNYGYSAKASLDKKDFYFWGENLSNGGFRIHCRRALDQKFRDTQNTYTEFAFEIGFILSGADERVEIIGESEITDPTKKYFLARPAMTLPYFQQMKFGKQYGKTNGSLVNGDDRMVVKTNIVAENTTCITLLNGAMDYILTYPQQFKHNVSGQPFFFNHRARSYFFRYKGQAVVVGNSGTY